jgi:hypothetical protein
MELLRAVEGSETPIPTCYSVKRKLCDWKSYELAQQTYDLDAEERSSITCRPR